MAYVDGFVIPMPKKNVAAYRRIASKAAKVWMEHGALEYRECVGDDLKIKGMFSFLAMTKAKKGETVVFAWIVYKSRKDRDRVNAKVMKDERLNGMMDMNNMPFEMKRMAMGGFKIIVDA